MEIATNTKLDRRYKTRKRAYEPYPHVLRLRILEKFLTGDELDSLVGRYKGNCKISSIYHLKKKV